MDLKFCIAVLSAVLFGILWAQRYSKPFLIITDGKIHFPNKSHRNKMLLTIPILILLLCTGTLLGLNNILHSFDYDKNVLTIIVALSLQILGFLVLTAIGYFIAKPAAILKLKIPGISEISQIGNKITSIAALIIWFAWVIFLGFEFETVNGIIIGCATLLSIISVIGLIIMISVINLVIAIIVMIGALFSKA